MKNLIAVAIILSVMSLASASEHKWIRMDTPTEHGVLVTMTPDPACSCATYAGVPALYATTRRTWQEWRNGHRWLVTETPHSIKMEVDPTCPCCR